MDNNKLVTLFYSNYSGNCKALLQSINNTHIMDNLSIKYVNIDNDTIKKVILKKFTVVPSIIVLSNNEISLYTGDNVFEWFNIYLSSLPQPSNESNLNTVDYNQFESDNSKSSPNQSQSIMEKAIELSKAREKLP